MVRRQQKQGLVPRMLQTLDMMFKDYTRHTDNNRQTLFKKYQAGLLEHVRLRLDAASVVGSGEETVDTGLCDDTWPCTHAPAR